MFFFFVCQRHMKTHVSMYRGSYCSPTVNTLYNGTVSNLGNIVNDIIPEFTLPGRTLVLFR